MELKSLQNIIRIEMPAAPKNKAAEFTFQHGVRQLIIIFLAWKLLLLVVAYASPGPGYDTSTQLLFAHCDTRSESSVGRAIEHVVARLTRWDGIYFAALSERGHLNEQEWAFSWTLARVTSFIARGALWSHPPPSSVRAKYVYISIQFFYGYHSRCLPLSSTL